MDIIERLNKRMAQIVEARVNKEMHEFYQATWPGYQATQEEMNAHNAICTERRKRRTAELKSELANRLVNGLIDTHVKSKD